MKKSRALFAASLAFASILGLWASRAVDAQQPGFKRVELQRHDVAIAGREAVQVRGEFAAGAAVPKHTHPGEEVAYILEGQVVLEVEGKPPVTLKAGDVFFVPTGTVHTAKNTGTLQARVLSTYFVEKGKPLASLVK